MSAAARLRRLDEHAQIVVFERGPEVSYANCGLPYYVGGAIAERESLLLQTPASLRSRFRLDVRVRHDVVGVDTAQKVVEVMDIDTGRRFTQRYDTLILATGARPRRMSPLRRPRPQSADGRRRGRDRCVALTPRSAGGGRRRWLHGPGSGREPRRTGASVTLVQRGPHLLSPLDAEMAAPIAAEIRARGVDVRLGVEVATAGSGAVTLTDGSSVAAELVIDASGVVPETALAEGAGIRLGETGGIAVDSMCRTSAPDVFAVGDGVEKLELVGGDTALITMAGLANRHGRMVADLIAGRTETVRPALGTGIVRVFGIAAAKVGWSERQLRAAGREFYVVHVHPGSHAGTTPVPRRCR